MTPLSTNGFYRRLPDGTERWEEYVSVASDHSTVMVANRWAAFTDAECFGIYSIVSAYADKIAADAPLKIMRAECVAELERRQSVRGGA